jgi:predicted AAA+ superfamily ATPase
VNLWNLCHQHKFHKEVIFMDPVENPYSPGAGSPPPELAGRDRIRGEQVRVAIARIRVGNSAKSVLMVGLRGVGKTVLLHQMRSDAERTGIHTIRIEAPENKSLPALLAPQLRLALLRLSHVEAAKSLATKGLRALAGPQDQV